MPAPLARRVRPLVHRIAVAVAPLLLALVLDAPVAASGAAAATPTSTPGGHWQTPGEFQQPKGPWQTPGEIQKPGEIQRVVEQCKHRLVMAADTLFAFDQSTLSPQAETTLQA